VVAITPASVLRDEVRLPVKLRKRVDSRIGYQHDIATVPTVATTRSAPWQHRLSYERDDPVTAVTGPDFYYCRIKHVEI
jgi:hypothetical protein